MYKPRQLSSSILPRTREPGVAPTCAGCGSRIPLPSDLRPDSSQWPCAFVIASLRLVLLPCPLLSEHQDRRSSALLDIRSPEGMAGLRGLIARSDVVLNNLRPGAMERQGLGFAQLAEIKPDIIAVSIKMWGNDGPLGHQTGYAPCFAALAGLASLVGYPGGPPLRGQHALWGFTVGAPRRIRRGGGLATSPARTAQADASMCAAVETLSSMIEHARTEPHRNAAGARRRQSHADMCPHRLLPVLRRCMDQHCGDQQRRWASDYARC